MVIQREHDQSKAMKNQKNVSGSLHDSIQKCIDDKLPDEPAWKELSSSPGLTIWRISKFKLEKIESKDHGNFFDGDSYIVLNTYLNKSNRVCYDVFIWIGKFSTPDEFGTAAYKMAELDVIVLKDAAVQHREMQSNESPKFVDLFEKISIMKGGVQSGFKKGAKEIPEPKLLHVSGIKNKVRVEEISYRRDNLTEDDVYIIDNWDKAYQVNGAKCSKEEKFKGASVLSEIKSKRGKVITEIIDDFSSATKHEAIESLPLKNKKNMVKKTMDKKEKSLWRLSDASGKIEMSQVASGKFTKSNLDTADVFIIDSDEAIYVWVGRKTSQNEKMCAMVYAQKYAEEHSDSNKSLVKVVEGNETDEVLALLA